MCFEPMFEKTQIIIIAILSTCKQISGQPQEQTESYDKSVQQHPACLITVEHLQTFSDSFILLPVLYIEQWNVGQSQCNFIPRLQSYNPGLSV